MLDLLEQPSLTLQIMNRKLVAANNTENEEADGKKGLQETAVLGEQNAVAENGVAAVTVNGVAPTDANPAVVAVGC